MKKPVDGKATILWVYAFISLCVLIIFEAAMIINQPKLECFGDILRSRLTLAGEDSFDKFYFVVAYVKKSGVTLLASSLQEFKQSGGHVRAVVGVSRHQKNTSVQGLQYLLPLCDELWVYDNESPTSTFHPKVYIFEKVNEKAIVFIGSSNLTAGGLYTNYEVDSQSQYDLKEASQASNFLAVKQMFDYYSTPSEFCRSLSPQLLQELYTEGYLSNEEAEAHAESEETEVAKDKGKKVFGSKRISPPSATKPHTYIQLPLVDFGKVHDIWAMKGELLWRKQLTPRDLQIVSSRAAPTGVISLTQADFRVKGRVIDQTTYFRNDIFGGFDWKPDRPSSKAVATKVKFNAKIMDKDCGQYELTLRHNPKWESGQANYTTGISWGSLTKLIKNPAFIDKTFSLYAPLKGQKEPFFIEIG